MFVRWDGQTVEADEQARLPGLADTAVVRRFDAPEALDTRFYEVRAKSALNRVPAKSRSRSMDGEPVSGLLHACVYCFARPTHEYLDFDAGRDFEKEIVVKVNVPEVLRKELARPSWKREHVAMGTNTDPYQWVEGRYKLMRGIWEVLRDAANPCSILTKSPLLLRDLDLMLEVAARTEISACLSVPTLDEKAWRATEPHTPHPRARLEAVAELNRAGIPTGVLIAPLMPGINDAPEQIERIIELAARGRRGVDRRPDAVPRAARCATCSSTGCAPTGPTSCRATSGSTRGRAYVPERERRAIERDCAACRGAARRRTRTGSGAAAARRARSAAAAPRRRAVGRRCAWASRVRRRCSGAVLTASA